jgi:hypothetical protein
MLGGRLTAALVVAVALAAAAPASASQDPNPPWPQLLPPFPVSASNQPGPMPHCKRGRLSCVDGTIVRMRRMQNRFGCDHRAVFATTYLTLTKALRRTLVSRPHFFGDPRYLRYQIVHFSSYWFRMLRAVDRGKPIPEAWRIAIDTAQHGQVNAAQDMLLGINAHVQRDMPFVVADLGLVTPDGKSRKPDHDLGNDVLDGAYQDVVNAIRDRYDPLLTYTNANGSPADDVAGLEMVKGWREGVWRNAERLVNAKTKAQYDQVVASIETNAATTARMIAATPQPGYRAQRDAYCHDKLGR